MREVAGPREVASGVFADAVASGVFADALPPTPCRRLGSGVRIRTGTHARAKTQKMKSADARRHTPMHAQ